MVDQGDFVTAAVDFRDSAAQREVSLCLHPQ